MNLLSIQNLGMIITEQCNLNCGHCMRGEKTHKRMSNEVICATLSQVDMIGNLCICGGEPLLALDSLDQIFSYIIDHKIIVKQVTMVINGTIYSDRFLKLLERIENYIKLYMKMDFNLVSFTISFDEYHLKEITRLGMKEQYVQNIEKYRKSKYFAGFSKLHMKLFREGNAENLDPSLTVPYRPMNTVMTYVNNHSKLDIENGICNIGPLVTVNVDGIITECDASFYHQQTLYNYGNVLSDSIVEVFKNKGSKMLKPKKWNRETAKIIKKNLAYNK